MFPKALINFPRVLDFTFIAEPTWLLCYFLLLLRFEIACVIARRAVACVRACATQLRSVFSYAALFIWSHLASCYGNEADTIANCWGDALDRGKPTD